ncbi:hypothetical protein Pint_28085 [Pistacia integerrima]|uniref:Uncharacterized protein n=1 Tax=Pistacia integerrima TaxID=434235 RepID=A0ACC0YU26_9ROSI|nr:hypothetical protein Pint_28085 [Pistacia integerrima]
MNPFGIYKTRYYTVLGQKTSQAFFANNPSSARSPFAKPFCLYASLPAV